MFAKSPGRLHAFCFYCFYIFCWNSISLILWHFQYPLLCKSCTVDRYKENNAISRRMRRFTWTCFERMCRVSGPIYAKSKNLRNSQPRLVSSSLKLGTFPREHRQHNKNIAAETIPDPFPGASRACGLAFLNLRLDTTAMALSVRSALPGRSWRWRTVQRKSKYSRC